MLGRMPRRLRTRFFDGSSIPEELLRAAWSLRLSALMIQRVRFVALGLALSSGCGAAQPPRRASAEEALELLAAWITFVGIDDREHLESLQSEDFVYAEDGAPAVERTRHLRVCGEPTMEAVPGGWDVTLVVRTLGHDGLLRSGVRRLALRDREGRLLVARDTFDVETTRAPRPPVVWPQVAECHDSTPRGCLVIDLDGDRARRRLELPEPFRPPPGALSPIELDE